MNTKQLIAKLRDLKTICGPGECESCAAEREAADKLEAVLALIEKWRCTPDEDETEREGVVRRTQEFCADDLGEALGEK